MRSWYHTIEFPDGTITPGYFDTRLAPRFIPWPQQLAGARCLDVGTFDGFWAFEMERRGAGEIVALDLADPEALDWPYDYRAKGPEEVRAWRSERGPGFFDAAEALRSKANWINQSAYDLDPVANGMFDVVFCGALLLHLRDPIRALEAMRSVCRGTLVLAEGIEPTLEILSRRVSAAKLVVNIDQWWRPNSAGLGAMVHRAGFEVLEWGPRYVVPFGQGGAGVRHSRIDALIARGRGKRGVLHRALRAKPRAPADSVA
jgi:tRNA (mo5U34)-methyltransferase